MRYPSGLRGQSAKLLFAGSNPARTSKNMNQEKPREVVSLVFHRDGKLLLEQRLDEVVFKNRWTFTGGKVEEVDYESDDYIMAASVRESGEETGLIPEEIEVFDNFVMTTLNGQTYEYHAVYVRNFSGVVQNREAGRRNIEWVGEGIEADLLLEGDHVNTKIIGEFRDFMSKKESQ